MTQFLILSFVRGAILIGLVSYLTSSIFTARPARLAIAAIIALGIAAFIDGTSPDGWEFEYMLGHPAYFYVFANAPSALIALALYLLWPLASGKSGGS